MKILLIVSKNTKITDNISNFRLKNLDIIVLKSHKYLSYYLEEYIPDYAILDCEIKNVNWLENFLAKNPKIRLFLTSEVNFSKKNYSNIIYVNKLDNIDDIAKIINIISSFEEDITEEVPKVSENFKIVNQQFISVISTKGGTGKTNIAYNIASIICNQLKLKTILVDLNFSTNFSDLATYLKINVIPNLSYYFENYKDGLDALNKSIYPISSEGLSILLPPISTNIISILDKKIFNSFFDLLKSNYNVVIFDFPPLTLLFNDFFKNIFSCSTLITMVSISSKTCAVNAAKTKNNIHSNQKFFQIINNPYNSNFLTMKEFEKITGYKIDVEIPFFNNRDKKYLKFNGTNTDIIEMQHNLKNFLNNFLIK